MDGVIIKWHSPSKSGLIISGCQQKGIQTDIWYFTQHSTARYNPSPFCVGARVTFNPQGLSQAENVFVTNPKFTDVDLRGGLKVFQHLVHWNEVEEGKTNSHQISPTIKPKHSNTMSIDDSNSLKVFNSKPLSDNKISINIPATSDHKSSDVIVPQGIISARDLTKGRAICKCGKNNKQVELVVVEPNFFGGNISCYAFDQINELKGGYVRHEITNNNIVVYNYHITQGTVNTDQGAFVFLNKKEVEDRSGKLNAFWVWYNDLIEEKQQKDKDKRDQKLLRATRKRENKLKYSAELQLLKQGYPAGTWNDGFLLELLGKYDGNTDLCQIDDEFNAKNGL